MKRLGLKDGFDVVNGDRDNLHDLYGIDTPISSRRHSRSKGAKPDGWSCHQSYIQSFSSHPVLREVRAVFPGAVFNDQGRGYTEEEVIAYFDGADGVVVGLEPITDGCLPIALI